MGELPKIDEMRGRLKELKAARERAKIDQSPKELHLGQREVMQQQRADAVPLKIPEKQKMEEALRTKAKENQQLINSQGYFPKKGIRNVAKVSTDEPAPMKTAVENTPVPPAAPSGPETAPEVVPATPAAPDTKTEDGPSAPEKKLEELKADLEAKRAEYARFDLDISGRWNKLKKVLGLGVEEIKDSGVEEKKNQYKEALKKYRQAKQVSMGNLTKEQAAELYSEFTAGEAVRFLEVKGDENAKMKKEKGEWPESVMNGYMNIVKNFRDLSFKKKILISAGIMAGGAVAGMTFGVAGASVFTIAGAGYRAISGGASGLGLKKLMDAISAKREKRAVSKEVENILSQDDWLNQLNAKLDEAVGAIDIRIGRMESKDLTRRRIATYAGIFVGSGAMAQIIQSTGFGGFVKEKLFGGGVIKPSVSDHVTEAVKPYAASEITQPQSGQPMDSVVSDTEHPYHQEYSSESRATKGGANFAEQSETDKAGSFIEEARTSPAAGAEISEPTVKASSAMEEYAKSPAAGAEVQTPEIAKPQFEEITTAKIGKGGTMWGSIENNIKGNPKAYGLDPKDPHFARDMHRMTQQMLDEFASRKGLSYEQLDQMARGKIQAGDTFKIMHDPSTRDIYIDDFHGKAFGADVSQAASVEEIASNKPPASPTGGKIAPEDLKPRAGVAEHQPARGGQIIAPQEFDPQQKVTPDYLSKIAEADQELAARHPGEVAQNAADLAMANHQLYVANRGLLGEVFHKLGISKYYNIYDQSMAKWNDLIGTEPMVAQDVQFADAINTSNEGWKQLNMLRSILEQYNTSGHETIGECLRRAIADPNLDRIGRGESIGARVQQLINGILKNK